jgi:hypothetical protein
MFQKSAAASHVQLFPNDRLPPKQVKFIALLDLTSVKDTFPMSAKDRLLRSKESAIVNFPKVSFMAPQ